MKFKKTKLTALAMSVLMAASTITSVTWAADLFTDGAPAEVAVEAEASEFDSGVETEVVQEVLNEENVLLSAASIDEDTIAFGYKLSNGTFTTDETKSAEAVSMAVQYTIKEAGKADVTVVTVDEIKALNSNEAKAATCTEPAKARFQVNIGVSGVNSFVSPNVMNVAGSKPLGHTYGKVTKPLPTPSPASCEKGGRAYSYDGCTRCDAWFENKSGAKDDRTDPLNYKAWDSLTPGEKAALEKDLDKLPHVLGEESRVALGTVSLTDVDTGSKTDDLAQFDGLDMQDVNLRAVYDYTHLDPSGNPTIKGYEWYLESSYNCKLVNNIIQVENLTEDAYYYVVRFCSNCDYRIYEKIIINVGEKLETVYYEADSTNGNTAGFVIGKLPERIDTYTLYPSADKKEEITATVLVNCNKSGYYWEVHRNINNGKELYRTKIEVPAGHVWGSVEVDNKATTEENRDLLQTVDGALWDDGGTLVVKRDAQNNVIEAYSNNCKKQAEYVLYHRCLNGSCPEGKADEDNDGTKEVNKRIDLTPSKKTELGSHRFEEWEADLLHPVYSMIDDKTHKKHYMDVRTCSICGTEETRDSQIKADEVEDHTTTLASKKVEGSDVPPTCGESGSYKTGLGCAKCEYIKEDTITDVEVPATEEHDFTNQEVFVKWVNEVQVTSTLNNYGSYGPYGLSTQESFEKDADEYYSTRVFAEIVRTCNKCGKDILVPNVRAIVSSKNQGLVIDKDSIEFAKKDPATGKSYPCSKGSVTLVLNWKDTVDGEEVNFVDETYTVPYYPSNSEYESRTAHQAGDVEIESETEATAEKEGSYDKVIYCRVCGDEMSRETVTVPKLDPEVQVGIPTVTATAVNYNTVNVSWTPVEGATSYRLYYRSADLGITTWHRVRTLKGTSFTHSGLTTGARYRYTVRAEVDGKLGDYSKTGSVARPLPAAPEMKNVTAVSNGTKVTWSKVDGADGYIIFRKTPTGTFTRVGSVSKGTKVTWTDKKAVSGSTYKVRAYRTVDNVNYKGAFSAAM